MAYDFAKFDILGHIGKDPVVTGAVLRLNIARNISWKDKESGERQERTEWNTVTVFDRHPSFKWILETLKSGDLVHVQGSIKNTEYEKDGEKEYGVSLIADTIDLIPTGRNQSA